MRSGLRITGHGLHPSSFPTNATADQPVEQAPERRGLHEERAEGDGNGPERAAEAAAQGIMGTEAAPQVAGSQRRSSLPVKTPNRATKGVIRR
jgi:hypothetical protein